MDLKMLKSFKKGDQVNCGLLFPTLNVDEEIRWTARTVIDGKRDVKGVVTTFRFVEFALDYLGVDMGAVRASEDDLGGVRWETVQ